MNTSEQEPDNGGGASRAERILIVDDEEVIRTLLREVLTTEGYQVVTAVDGQDGIAALEGDHFDLVITDLVMPRANGIEVLQASKRTDPERPVIILTGYPSVETVVRMVRLGAADYITKPFNVDVVKVTVAKHLEMRRRPESPPRADEPSQSDNSDPNTEAPAGDDRGP